MNSSSKTLSTNLLTIKIVKKAGVRFKWVHTKYFLGDYKSVVSKINDSEKTVTVK